MSRDDRLPAISPALANIVAKLSEDLKEGEDPLYWDVERFGKRDEAHLLPDQAEVYEAPVTPPIAQPTPAGETQTVRLNVEPPGAAANLPTMRLPRRRDVPRASVLALGLRHPALRLLFYKAAAPRRWLVAAGIVVLALGALATALWVRRAAQVGVAPPLPRSAPPSQPVIQVPTAVAPSAHAAVEFPPTARGRAGARGTRTTTGRDCASAAPAEQAARRAGWGVGCDGNAGKRRACERGRRGAP